MQQEKTSRKYLKLDSMKVENTMYELWKLTTDSGRIEFSIEFGIPSDEDFEDIEGDVLDNEFINALNAQGITPENFSEMKEKAKEIFAGAVIIHVIGEGKIVEKESEVPNENKQRPSRDLVDALEAFKLAAINLQDELNAYENVAEILTVAYPFQTESFDSVCFDICEWVDTSIC